MEVKSMSIDDIKPYENNPRDNDDAVDSVANSIKEFGWQQPIVVDKDMVIIVGHTRYKAAKKLGMDKVPSFFAASSLTPEQVKAYRLADNKVGELADWDMEKLSTELDGIEDIDMSEFGFEDLGEPELPDDFFVDDQDNDSDEPEQSEEPELDWGGANTAPITSDDQSFLDDKFEEFRQQEGIKSFLQFLLSE